MALTVDYREFVVAYARSSSEHRKALLQGGCSCMADGEISIAKAFLRDYIDATIGFEELARILNIPCASLKRMLAKRGNPPADDLLMVIRYLSKQEGVELEFTTAKGPGTI